MPKPIRVAVMLYPRTQMWSSVADQDGVLLCVVDDQGPLYEVPLVDSRRIRAIFQSSPIPDDEIPYP